MIYIQQKLRGFYVLHCFKTAIITGIFTLSLSAHIQADALQSQAKAMFGVLPNTMPGSENDSVELIALGEKLYMDKRLSVNNSQSCNTCHNVTDGGPGVDNTVFSAGAIVGKFGGRNAPTVWNAGFQLAQFWDGRAKDLKEQAKGPILNPVEMAMPSEQAVIDRISHINDYQVAFKKAFKQDNAITYDNLAHAIAAFERTLVTKDRFDQYMNGDTSALNAQEKAGLQAFINTGCIACHSGPTLGGSMYQKLGLVKPYDNQSDQGRFDLTQNAAEKMVFKVPMLRDVARTAPYFHDGKVKTLEEAVKTMAALQLGRELEQKTITDIVAFLKSMNHEHSL